MHQEGFSFSFDPGACATCNGHCCVGESGYIWVGKQEAEAMARRLQITVEEFRSTYLKKVGYKYSLRELHIEGAYHCVFFDARISGCSLYDVRPSQCRTFPFWEHFRKNPTQAGDECPGIVYHS